jgi:hypothetical protein
MRVDYCEREFIIPAATWEEEERCGMRQGDKTQVCDDRILAREWQWR